MAARIIPTSSTLSNYSQRTTLSGKEYVLEFRWSERSSSWYLRLLDSDGNILTGLLRIVLNMSLLRLHRPNDALPPGDIVAIDTSGDLERPEFDELGKRIKLAYVT